MGRARSLLVLLAASLLVTSCSGDVLVASPVAGLGGGAAVVGGSKAVRVPTALLPSRLPFPFAPSCPNMRAACGTAWCNAGAESVRCARGLREDGPRRAVTLLLPNLSGRLRWVAPLWQARSPARAAAVLPAAAPAAVPRCPPWPALLRRGEPYDV